MKLTSALRGGFCLVMLIFISSCATRQGTVPPGQQGSTDLPGIGTRQVSLPEEKTKPPILVSLIKSAKKKMAADEYEAAFATLERALGVDSQDPLIWHLMAKTRLMQGQGQQAEALAKKSNIVASQTPSLLWKNKRIIDAALKLQGKTPGTE